MNLKSIINHMLGNPDVLYIGLNDKEAVNESGDHIQVISDKKAEAIVFEYMDCSIIRMHGKYTMNGGKVVHENSFKVEVFGKKHGELVQIARELCVRLNQESIIVNGEFITAAA